MTKFYVVCDDYRMPVKTREAAERRADALNRGEGACALPHHVEEAPDEDRR